MALETAHTTDIRFEGFTPGTEIWGVTQANFLVRPSGAHGKETAVQLNDPAARMLAEATGNVDSAEFRERAAQAAGEAILTDVAARGASPESIIVASNGYFADFPDLLERVKAALA
ncbi:hypothetical protein [Candidatus Amarobacter glycogenicus]|jgi:hypothetical protein|uniref:hypothetical protein n=1 Tax=Candidatus Amarobacter glycogenicus TaxID=3140699 RepID=UPI0031363C4A|nr:hypothetical protein [Dehalococcoidia bacterium]MCC6266475.1 hypothetical protein [Dehalococcoidia bacterium]